MIILDVFFPTAWAKKNYPHLSRNSPGRMPLVFALSIFVSLVLLATTWWAKLTEAGHTLDQMLLGTELGLWCAFFSHYCLRDTIYSNIRRITSAGDNLSKKEISSYILWASGLVFGSWFMIYMASNISYETNQFNQLWLTNLRDSCGLTFEVDENGLILYDPKSIYVYTVVKYASVLSLYGLFLGQLLFRYTGCGKLDADAFSQNTIIH